MYFITIGFGTITQIVNGGPTCFAVEEVEKDSVDDRSMMKEAANLTPFKVCSQPYLFPYNFILSRPIDIVNIAVVKIFYLKDFILYACSTGIVL